MTSKQAEDIAKTLVGQLIRDEFENRFAKEKLKEGIINALKEAHAAGRRETEAKLNAHERSFLRVSIERDEAYERGRREVIAEVMPMIDFTIMFIEHAQALGYLGEGSTLGMSSDALARARALLEKLK